MSRFLDLIQQRCPRCGSGNLFNGVWAMAELCPGCGFRFEREPGYFFGASLFRMVFGLVLLLPISLMPLWWMPDLNLRLLVQGLLVALLLPFIHRYSRLAWMYMDHHFDPPSRAQPTTLRPSVHEPIKPA
jgi:uncharacterized protein (DUF983 family)